MKYSAFIFDFDFTLADASAGIVECFNHSFGMQGIAPMEHDVICKTIGMTLENAFNGLTGNTDIETARYFRKCFTEKADLIMTANTVLFPDTITVLEKLKAQNKKTGIVTSKNHYRIDEVFEKFNITHLMDCIIGFEDVENAKPAPEGLLKAIDILGVQKDEVLYVGDSLIDAETAKNAGVDFAGITTGTTFEFAPYPYISVSPDLSDMLNNVF